MFTAQQLATVAVAYSEATGRSLAALGVDLFNDHRFFKRLVAGKDCTTASATRALAWFAENWPKGAPWPEGVSPREAAE